MFKNAIVGVDGERAGRDAVRLASMLVASGGELTLAHVRHDIHLDARAESEALLAREAELANLDAQTLSVDGDHVGRALAATARERDADLLALGSSTRGPIGRVLIGDDTRAAINEAACAVAVAPHGYAPAHHRLQTVGLAWENSTSSHAAFTLARTLASECAAKVKALTVVTDPRVTDSEPALGEADADSAQPRWLAEQLLTDARRRLDELQGVEGEARIGQIVEQLVRFSASVDLLVLGSTTRSFLRRTMPGSIASALAHQAHCALLVAPPTPTAEAVGGNRGWARSTVD